MRMTAAAWRRRKRSGALDRAKRTASKTNATPTIGTSRYFDQAAAARAASPLTATARDGRSGNKWRARHELRPIVTNAFPKRST